MTDGWWQTGSDDGVATPADEWWSREATPASSESADAARPARSGGRWRVTSAVVAALVGVVLVGALIAVAATSGGAHPEVPREVHVASGGSPTTAPRSSTTRPDDAGPPPPEPLPAVDEAPLAPEEPPVAPPSQTDPAPPTDPVPPPTLMPAPSCEDALAIEDLLYNDYWSGRASSSLLEATAFEMGFGGSPGSVRVYGADLASKSIVFSFVPSPGVEHSYAVGVVARNGVIVESARFADPLFESAAPVFSEYQAAGPGITFEIWFNGRNQMLS